MRRVDLAWAAGLFDGEGYVSVRLDARKQTAMVANLTMTDRRTVYRFKKTIGIGNICTHGPYGNNRKQWWRWQVAGQNAAQAMRRIHPHLFLKKEQSRILLTLAAIRKGKTGKRLTVAERRIRDKCVQRMRLLKQQTKRSVMKHSV